MFGFGRWTDIADNARLSGHKTEEEIRSFSEAFVKHYLSFPEPEDDFMKMCLHDTVKMVKKEMKKWVTKKRSVPLASPMKSPKSPLNSPSKKQWTVSLSNNGVSKFCGGEKFNLKFSSPRPNTYLLVDYKEGKKSRSVRFIPCKPELSEMEIVAPGFSGEYKVIAYELRQNTVTLLDESVEFTVIPPAVLMESDMTGMSQKSYRMWAGRMILLRNLMHIDSLDTVQIPKCSLKLPAPWWNKEDDRKLLMATIKYGYGKYKEFLEDEEYEWDEKTIQERAKQQCAVESKEKESKDKKKGKEKKRKEGEEDEKEKEWFPSTSVLSKRLNRLVNDIKSLCSTSRESTEGMDVKKVSNESNSSKDSNRKKKSANRKDNNDAPIKKQKKN
jgi:hypothetical protein